MQVLVIVLSFHQIVIDVHCSLIIAIMKSAVSDSKVGLEVVALRVLSITL